MVQDAPVLLADQDDAACRVLLQVLGSQGVEVAVAAAPGELHRLLEMHGSALPLVVAGRLPGLGPQELLRAAQLRAPRAPVILLAGPADLAEALSCLGHGAGALLRKPLEPAEAALAVSQALERRALLAHRVQAEAMRIMLGAATPADLAATIVGAWMGALEADGAGLHLPGAGETGLSLGHAEGSCERDALVAAWLSARIGVDREPALLDPAAGCPEDAEWPCRARGGPVLLFPLVAGDRLVGVLSAERRRPFAAADLARAAPLAGQARLALDNAQLFGHLVASDRLAAIGNLAASLAHEIKNPLTYALQNASFLAQNIAAVGNAACGLPLASPPAEALQLQRDLDEAAADSLDALGRIRDLVRDIGALSSPDESTRVGFDLNDAVRAAVRMTKFETAGRAKVLTRLGADLKLVGSAGRITQVFINLLVNAAHALAAEAAGEGRIVVLTRRDGDRVIAEVSDNGPGIPPAVLPRIFEPYFTTKPAGKGTGLGLFLCRDIVRRHRGEIRVRSSPTHGTTFTLELPAEGAVALRSESAPPAATLPPAQVAAGRGRLPN